MLGVYPELPLSAARLKREYAARLLKSDVDPAVERKQVAAARKFESETLFEAIAREWQEHNAPTWVRVHAADVIISLQKDVFPRIGNVPIAAVTSPMILEVVRAIEARPSLETAKRVRQRISAIYGYAIATGRASSNPAEAIRGAMRPQTKKPQPALSTLAEARALLMEGDAAAVHSMTKLASRLMALTALRPGVLRTTPWSELEPIDGYEPVWRIRLSG